MWSSDTLVKLLGAPTSNIRLPEFKFHFQFQLPATPHLGRLQVISSSWVTVTQMEDLDRAPGSWLQSGADL